MNNYPQFTNPVLADQVLANIQQGLKDSLPWLDNAFGRAQRLLGKTNAGKRYFYPAVWTEGDQYLQMWPDKTLGNFSFFKFNDPQTVDWPNARPGTLAYPVSLIVWWDTRTTDPKGERNIEAVKAQILGALKGGFLLKEGRLDITRIYEDAENIYRDYTVDQIDDQFLMQPYAGLRLDGTLKVDAPCQ